MPERLSAGLVRSIDAVASEGRCEWSGTPGPPARPRENLLDPACWAASPTSSFDFFRSIQSCSVGLAQRLGK